MPLDVNKLIQIALVKRAQDLQEARSQRQSGLQEKHDEAIIAQMQEMIASSQQQRGVREGIEQLLKNIRLPSPPAGEGFAKNLPLRGGMGALGQMGPAVAEAQGAQKRRRADITELATRGQFGPGALALSPGMAGMQLSFGEATRQAPRIAAGLAPTAAQAGGLKLGRDQLLLQEQQQTLQGMFEALRTLPEFPTEDFSDVTDMKGLISKIGKAGLTTMGELDAKYKVLSSLVTMRGQDFGMKIAEMNNLARVYVAQGANPEAAALKARADMMNALLAGIKNIGAAVEAAKTAGNNKGARNLADGMSQLLQMSYDFMGYDVQVEGEPPGRFFGHGLRQPLSLLNAMGVTGEQQGAPDLQTMIDQAIAGAGGNVDSVLDMVIPGATAGGGAGGAGRTAPLGFGARRTSRLRRSRRRSSRPRRWRTSSTPRCAHRRPSRVRSRRRRTCPRAPHLRATSHPHSQGASQPAHPHSPEVHGATSSWSSRWIERLLHSHRHPPRMEASWHGRVRVARPLPPAHLPRPLKSRGRA
jgi:hypothetical protein